jgi:hypothetical protein
MRVQPFDTSEVVQLGRYKLSEGMELTYAMLQILKVGTAGGSETLTLKLFGSSDYAGTAIATSTAGVLATAMSGLGTNPIADIRFDFARQNLNPNLWYYAAIVTANYTRNANTYYLAAVEDWPFPRNTISGAGAAAALTFVGYQEE